ncbi:MAG TPA: thioredoxin domain-containing protein [Chlamydiales bacterium]|nr:thioredoxin domain-containing protein [Chlamydiales bacterium]
MEQRKRLVLVTIGVALTLFLAGSFYQIFRWPNQLAIEAKNSPTIGGLSAKLEMVAFEDFKCPHCCHFSKEIFPQIKAAYVDTGLARYTIVPLAFLDGSKVVANAVLAVYRQNPSRFLPFIQEVFTRCLADDELGEKELFQMAKEVGGINLALFQWCLDTHCYYEELEKNLHGARKLMGRDFATPTLYVDGIFTPTSSFRSMQKRIEKILAQKENP